MKKLFFFIVMVIATVTISAQTTSSSEPTWQVLSEISLPDTCTFVEGLTKNGNPKVHTIINGKKISINYNSYKKYKEGNTILILVEWIKEGKTKYTIRQLSKDEILKDMHIALNNYEAIIDMVYKKDPNLILDIIMVTDEYYTLKELQDKYNEK